jgi:hypothetical protein
MLPLTGAEPVIEPESGAAKELLDLASSSQCNMGHPLLLKLSNQHSQIAKRFLMSMRTVM